MAMTERCDVLDRVSIERVRGSHVVVSVGQHVTTRCSCSAVSESLAGRVGLAI